MPVKKDASGRRSVEAEVEVPGTPDQVWQAIATGPGISSWFVPSEVEQRDGGKAVSHFAPDGSMDSVGKITTWTPPHRFVVETNNEGPGGTGTVATEWTVEARAGGTCVVRVVHNWFASTDDWDDQMERHTHGWVVFFRILRLYLAHFRGQHGVSFQLMATAPEPMDAAWKALVEPLGIAGAAVGGRIGTVSGAPPLAGTVHSVGPRPEWPELLVQADAPAPGIAHFFPMPMGGQVFLIGRMHLFGKDAAEVVARVQPVWEKWIGERFARVGG
jgi:uncharacterized protein YndB with AHSA1/START domain